MIPVTQLLVSLKFSDHITQLFRVVNHEKVRALLRSWNTNKLHLVSLDFS